MDQIFQYFTIFGLHKFLHESPYKYREELKRNDAFFIESEVL